MTSLGCPKGRRARGWEAEPPPLQAALSHSFPLLLRVLAPQTRRQHQALRFIPSLLGRDILSHFALYIEEATNLVLLLEPEKAAAVRRHLF